MSSAVNDNASETSAAASRLADMENSTCLLSYQTTVRVSVRSPIPHEIYSQQRLKSIEPLFDYRSRRRFIGPHY